jgi:hypothetical protein
MKSEIIQLQNQFEVLSQRIPDTDVEFWFARDLMEPLGYSRWENFQTAIKRAIESCESTGYKPDDHFRGVTKMIPLGKGAERLVEDFTENLPPAEDVMKLERKFKADERKLEKQSGKLTVMKDKV